MTERLAHENELAAYLAYATFRRCTLKKVYWLLFTCKNVHCVMCVLNTLIPDEDDKKFWTLSHIIRAHIKVKLEDRGTYKYIVCFLLRLGSSSK